MSAHTKADKTFGKKGLTVDVRQGRDEKEQAANLEHAIKLLKRRITQEGLIRDLRKNEYYEQPSVVRRRKHKESVRNAAKAQRNRKI